MIEIFLWFGFLGVKIPSSLDDESTYIYNVYYDMKKLKRLARELSDDDIELTIHKAFWPFLEIEDKT